MIKSWDKQLKAFDGSLISDGALKFIAFMKFPTQFSIWLYKYFSYTPDNIDKTPTVQ